MDTTHKLTNHTLPPDVVRQFSALKDTDNIEDRNDYIAVLRRKGWTLQSIAAASDVTRERVRQISVAADPKTTTPFVVPELPLKRVPKPRVIREPDPVLLARMRELQPLATKVRSSSPRFRKEAEEYTSLLWDAHRPTTRQGKNPDGTANGVYGQGVSLYRLSKLLGVTHSALNFRLVRYGYKKAKTGTSRVYRAIDERNRIR